MYVPPHFAQDDPSALAEAVRRWPLATLVTHAAGAMAANHLPMLLETGRGEHGTLVFHVSRANPVWRTLAEGGEALAIFSGADAYVSPSAYPSKAEHGKVVPTWNYVAVHAYGTPQIFDEADALRALVTRLTAVHEAGRAMPWEPDDAPPEFIDAQLRGIVGVKLHVSRVLGKVKMSQNRPAADRAGVAADLRAAGNDDAAAMVDRA